MDSGVNVFECDGFRGEAVCDFPQGLLASLARAAESGVLPAGAIEIKQNLMRTVFRIPGESGKPAIFGKVYRFPSFFQRIKYLAKPTGAQTEFRVARELAKLGIPSLEALAFGVKSNGLLPTRAFFASREVADGKPWDFSFRALEPPARRKWIDALGQSVARLHRDAVFHRDLHLGNLLARGDAPELVWIDLHRIRLGGELSIRERCANLAQMAHALAPHGSAQEIARFVEAYSESFPDRLPSLPVLQSELARLVQRLTRVQARSRDKRCLLTSSQFVTRWTPQGKLFRRREFSEGETFAAIAAHREAPRQKKSSVLKQDGRNRITRIEHAHPENTGADRASLCVKESGFGGIGSFLQSLSEGSRGRRAWAASHALLRREIPTPKCFALWDERVLNLPVRSFLVMEFLENSATLLDFFSSRYASLSREKKIAFLSALAVLVAKLHRAGLYHRDLQVRNILVQGTPSNAWRLFLVDLESLAPRLKLTAPRRMRNLMQLNDCPSSVSRSDRRRFLARYEKAFGKNLSRPQIREIAAATRARLDRAARRSK